MTHDTPDDAVSVLTEPAESVFEVESLYETSSITPEGDDGAATHAEASESATISQAAKAIEAATEQDHIRYPSVHGDSDEDGSPDVPVVRDAGPAPPDYAAATASRAMAPQSQEEVPPQHTSQPDIEAQSGTATDSRLKDPKLLIKQAVSKVRPALHAAWEQIEPYYTRVVIVIRPAARLTWEKVEPIYQKVSIVVAPVARTVWVKIEPRFNKVVLFVEPYFKRTAEVVNPAILTGGTRVERRLRQFAVANEPRLHKAWTYVEPASKKTASAMSPVVRNIVKQADKFLRLLVNKHTTAFVRKHWLHILLVNITCTFALLFIISTARPPEYVDVEMYPEFFSAHPRRGFPAQFHPYVPDCPSFYGYSPFTHARIERSGDFTFQEHLDLSIDPELSNISYTGRIDVRPAPVAQRSPVEVWFNTASTSHFHPDAPRFRRTGNAITMQMPEVPEYADYGRLRSGEGRQCIDTWVGVYVKIEMKDFSISTDHFSVNIKGVEEDSAWGLTVKEKIQISTKNGTVESDVEVNAKETIVTTEEGIILGTFLLRDKLQLEGRLLDVTAEQQPRGQYIPDEALDFVTPSVLRTASTTGGTVLRLDERSSLTAPEWVYDNSTGNWTSQDPEEDTVDNYHSWIGRGGYYLLDALHTSSDSGDMSLAYSSAWSRWEGTINGSVRNGTINFENSPRDYNRDNQRKSPNVTQSVDGEHLHAVVGSSNSTVRFNSSGGHVDVMLDNW